MSDDSVDDPMHLTTSRTDSADEVASTGRETIIDIESGELVSVALDESGQVIPMSDSGAFAVFYESERPKVVRALSLALHDDDFGTDAADEAFVRACQSWGSVRGLSNPTGWVYRVGLNWAHSALRRRRRHRAKQALFASSETTHEPRRDVDLHHALAGLSDAHRSVVVCRYYLDWSVNDTADALGVPVGTIKSRLTRALEQLESSLRPSAETPQNGNHR